MVTGDGGEFGRAYRALELAVAERRAAEPGWKPSKEPTPGLDKDFSAKPSPELDTWLRERKAGFAAWLAEYAERPERWDFSVASLDELEAVVLRRVSGPAELAERTRVFRGCRLVSRRGVSAGASGALVVPPGGSGRRESVHRSAVPRPAGAGGGRQSCRPVLLKGILARREPGLLRRLAAYQRARNRPPGTTA